MIAAAAEGFLTLSERLIRKAEQLAAAHIADANMRGRNDPRRWRNSRLIWPTLAGDPSWK